MNKDLEVIYDGTVMEAIKKHQIYIVKSDLAKLSSKERLNLVGNPSWKGQLYEVQVGERITFDRSNNWDRSYFKLGSGVSFLVECGNPLAYFEPDNFKLIHLEGNPCDERYLNFIEKYPKFKN